jgi:ankyrin repeat protein
MTWSSLTKIFQKDNNISNIWVCYSTEDISLIKSLIKELYLEGFSFPVNRPFSESVETQIALDRQKIQIADYFIAVLSENNLSNKTFEDHLTFAISNGKRIISVIQEDTQIPDLVADPFFVVHTDDSNAFKNDIGLLSRKLDPALSVDAFISYSRKDKEMVLKIDVGLKKAKKRTWMDQNDIVYTEEWWKAIQDAIQAADSYIFMISPASIDSKYCNEELGLAIKNKKHIVPVLIQSVKGLKVSQPLEQLQWLDLMDAQNIDENIDKLIGILNNNPEYLKTHTKYLLDAKDWLNGNKNTQRLLRGRELRIAEKWFKAPVVVPGLAPTELQLAYLKASRRFRAIRYAVVWALLVIAILLISYNLNDIFWSGFKAIKDKYNIFSTSDEYPANWIYLDVKMVVFVAVLYLFLLYLKIREGYTFSYLGAILPLLVLTLALSLFFFNLMSEITEYYDFSNTIRFTLGVITGIWVYGLAVYFKKRGKNKLSRKVTITASVIAVFSFLYLLIFGFKTLRSSALETAVDADDIAFVQAHVKDTALLKQITAQDLFPSNFDIRKTNIPCTAQSKVNIAKILIANDVPFNGLDNNGKTLAHRLITENQADLLDFLIKHGLNADIKDIDGNTPLMTAVTGSFETNELTVTDREALLAKLLAAGAHINLKNNSGQTALLLASSMESGAQMDAECDLRLMKFLIDHGADINTYDISGDSPLLEATGRPCFEATKYLVEKGAEISHVDKGGYTAVTRAAIGGESDVESIKTTQYLLTHTSKSMLNQRLSTGDLPFTIVAKNGRDSLVAFFQKNGVNEAFLIDNGLEEDLNTYGYYLMRKKQLDKAIFILKLNTKKYPFSANAWESLGEAYFNKGDNAKALVNLKISLSKNPSQQLKSDAEGIVSKISGNK